MWLLIPTMDVWEFVFQETVTVEAIAASYAAEFSRDLGLSYIVFEGDSLQVVNALKEEG
jgi:hypothetical protein